MASVRRMSPQDSKKLKMLDRVAEDNGVAVVVLDDQAVEISASNNNSICRALYTSKKFGPRCAEYCGVAFRETADGADFEYECHAGLKCRASRIAARGKQLVAIVGRTFTSAENYRKATDRATAGDWRGFSPNDFFENVLISSSIQPVERAVSELSKYPAVERDDIPQIGPGPAASKPASRTYVTEKPVEVQTGDDWTEPIAAGDEGNSKRVAEARELRSLVSRLANMDYVTGCREVLEHLRSEFGFESMVWLERADDALVPVTATGDLARSPIRVGTKADNKKLVKAADEQKPFILRQKTTGKDDRPDRTLSLFGVLVANDIRAAVGVEAAADAVEASRILRVCRVVGVPLEMLRLRREISSREWLDRAVARFNESLKLIDDENFWTEVTQLSAELIQSERASLLLKSETSEGLLAKAAVGTKMNLFTDPSVGTRIARLVLEEGEPLVVEDLNRIGIQPAPAEWKYKTSSFLSYPILIGERRIGVMNFTDKAGGESFGRHDLELLKAIAPQIAVAVDRTVLRDRAGRFEQLSVTDALTGLLNRRYLEKRLVEEIQRSRRHRFPMSLMLLDVDEFKSYNDRFGHPAGDKALKIVAGVLLDIIRGADVAARYGGEEFAILLPQTTSVEAAGIAERLRQRIERTEFPKRRVTVSIGIASCTNEIETPSDIIDAADQALYEAKNQGRNNVQVYDAVGRSLNKNIN